MNSPEPKAAVRLVFSYEGTAVRLESRQRLETVTPPSDPIERPENETGFWIELRDAKGNLLHRRVMPDPTRADAEVFSDDAERSIARIPVDNPRGAFTALVPDLPGADHVALVSSAPRKRGILRRRRRRAKRTEIARFDLHARPKPPLPS